MVREDFRVREQLARDGSLFDGYNPRMRAVHDQNARHLAEILEARGWPGRSLVGEDGAEAAWLVVQHAIAQPAFMRRGLALLEAAVAANEAPMRHAAQLEDRIRTFEGRRQRFGTEFDWDADGRMSPLPIDDWDAVEALRASAGLMPLEQAIRRQRDAVEIGEEPPPQDPHRRQRDYEAWLRQVGWRE